MTPSRFSRRATLLDTADGVVPSERAAAVNEPASTARTNAGKPLNLSDDIDDHSAKLIAPLRDWSGFRQNATLKPYAIAADDYGE